MPRFLAYIKAFITLGILFTSVNFNGKLPLFLGDIDA